MTEAPKKIWAADQEFAEGIEGPWHVDKSVYGGDLYHHDAEVQRLVAEARAEAFEEDARIADAAVRGADRAGSKAKLSGEILRHSGRAEFAERIAQEIRALSDAPPQKVTPQEADVSAAYLLEWMTYHHLPLQLWQEDDGSWVIVDNSTGSVLGSGETAEIALRAALRALANGGEG